MAQDCFVVLAHAHDTGARAVARSLVGSSVVPFVLPPEQLSSARWSHAVDAVGRTRTTLRLRGGRTLADTDIACLLNRIDYLPVGRFDRSSERDRDYAAMEIQALVASWLAGLGDRVVNRPTARATDAGPPSNRLWLALAAAHGLPVAPSALATSARLLPSSVRQGGLPVRSLGPWVPHRNGGSTGRVPVEVGWSEASPAATGIDHSDEVVVAGTRAVGPLAARFGEACVAVAAEADCRLVGFQLGRLGSEHLLHAVVPRPRLDQAEAIAAVAELVLAIGGDRGSRV